MRSPPWPFGQGEQGRSAREPRRKRNFNAKLNVSFTRVQREPRNFQYVMRRAFVLQLGPDTQPLQRQYDGWIEEVDTGRELRFRSTDELLRFLSECFECARNRDCSPYREEAEDEGPT
jgi:hypothetical protein